MYLYFLLIIFPSYTSQQSFNNSTSTPNTPTISTSSRNPFIQDSPTPFEFEFRSLKFVKPLIPIKNIALHLEDFFHIGVYFVMRSDQTFRNPKTNIASPAESFLTKLILRSNSILNKYTINLYLIDYITIQSQFPSTNYHNIYRRVTNILNINIGFPVITVFVDETVPNKWHITSNKTYAPCGPTFFHWNPALRKVESEVESEAEIEAKRFRFFYGNMIFKLFNNDNTVCKNCTGKCLKELAEKEWAKIEFYYTECLHQNMRESYYLGPFTCFTVLPRFTGIPRCGNGVIEGKEQCDCIIPCDKCRFNCTWKSVPERSSYSTFGNPNLKIAILGFAFFALLISGTFLLIRDSGKILSLVGSPAPIDRFRPDPQHNQQQQQQKSPELQLNKSKT